MEAATFARLAREIYGIFGAQSELARRHNVHRSTVQRWFRGEMAIPPTIQADLKKEAQRKAAAIVAAISA